MNRRYGARNACSVATNRPSKPWVGGSNPSGRNMNDLDRITFDPNVMGGKPCLRGMRVTVGTIVGLVAAGRTDLDILELYPYLEADDIQQALAYASWRSEEVDIPIANR